MSQQNSNFTQSKEEVWRQLCDEMTATFFEGESVRDSKVVAKVDEWTVTLDSHILETQHDRHVFTRLRAPFINKDDFKFEIYKAHFFSAIEKLFGLQDIKTGYPEFDDNYIVQSNNEEKIKTLLSNQAIRDMIKKQPTINIKVKEDEGWFHEEFPEGVDELYCLIEEDINDIDHLKQLYDLFGEILKTLCHIGSAYADDPNIELD